MRQNLISAVPAEANSLITTDNTSYVSGTDMVVTVTLKDAAGNAVTGQSAQLTATTVTVANATLKSGSNWTESGTTGVYTATYTAQAVGTGLVATLKLVSWTGKTSGTYAIDASTTPAEANSLITTDNSSYISGTDMVVTVTLKDAAGNAVTGQSAQLTATTVTVANATLKSGSNWTESGTTGVYTATYTAQAVSTGLVATLKFAGWTGVQSAAYAIVPVAPARIEVNGYGFAPDAGFPTTGFKGAEFTIIPAAGSAADFNWSANVPWVLVNDGVVTFTDTGNGNTVTITGTPKNGTGTVTGYTFKLQSWFITNRQSGPGGNWGTTNNYCKSQPNYSLPTIQQLNGSVSQGNGARGTLSGLWSEWGSLNAYPAWTVANFYWTLEPDGSGGHYRVEVNTGESFGGSDTNSYRMVCRQGL